MPPILIPLPGSAAAAPWPMARARTPARKLVRRMSFHPFASWRCMNRAHAPTSLDDVVGAQHDGLRNGNAERLRGLAVDDELEPRGQLNRKIGRLRALENLVDEGGDPVEHGVPVVRERDQPPVVGVAWS